jgi:hypothetical protein
MTNFPPRWTRLALLSIYYLLILLGIFVLYSSGSYKTPTFIYQGF